MYALTTHQLQVERRESHRASQVYALTTHQLQVERRERVIEPVKCMRSPHTSYRWRGERDIEPVKCMGIIRHIHIHDMTGQEEIIGLRLVIIFWNFFINTTYVHYLTTIFVTHFSVISDITTVSSRLILKRSEYLKHQTIMSCLP